MISIGLLAADWTLRGGICIYILQRRFWALAGLVISMLLVAMGELNKTHRGKTHSLLALLLSSVGVAFVHPCIAGAYAIGFISHIISDLFNKSEVRIFYPFDKKGICFKLCYAEKMANQIVCAIGMTIIFVYLYVMKMG